MSKSQSKKRIILIGIVAIILAIAFIIGISIMMRYRNYQNKVTEIQFTDIKISDIADGVYIGEYDVDIIYAKVEVTVQDGAITDIVILEHQNERGGSAEAIIVKIIEEQSLDVDAITSATNSSKVIKKAIENALTQ